MLYATVRQRKIYVKKPVTVIQNGIGVDELILDMDREWEEMDSIVCVFTLRYTETTTEEVEAEKNESTTVTTTVTKEVAKEILHTFGDVILVPWECLEKTGLLSISCTGYAGGKKVMTTMMPDSFWNVVQNGAITGETPMEPTPTLYEQVLAAAGTATQAAEAAGEIRAQLLADKAGGVFDGVSPTVEIGTVATGAPGTAAQVSNSGTAQAVKLNFVIPRGAAGPPGTPGRDGATRLAELEQDARHRTVTDEEKQAWNQKSDFSGDFYDLENLPAYGVVSAITYSETTGDMTILYYDAEGLKLSGLTIKVPLDPETVTDGSVLRARDGKAVWEAMGAGGGLSEAAKTLLIGILRNGVYQTDQSQQITALENALAAGDSGGTVTYTVQNVLTNVTSSNAISVIAEDAAYRAVLTAKDGYVLDTVTVTMGGRDITDTAYSGGVVEIAAVTGDIVITAAAVEDSSAVRYSITAELVNVTSSNRAADVEEGGRYLATLTAADGYEIDTVTVTMGGVDVTAAVYADGVITIASVTGNVEIVASAKVVSAAAALPEAGKVCCFDFRTAEYDNAGSGGSTIIHENDGTGILYTWANNGIAEQSEYGLRQANTRGYFYNADGNKEKTEMGTQYTFLLLTHGKVGQFGFAHSNVGVQWNFYPRYINGAGSSGYAEVRAGTTPTDGYCFCVVRVDGAALTEIMNSDRTAYDGTDLGGFVRWDDVPLTGVVMNTDTAFITAMAMYDRALTDIEIEEARAFFKTMEVTA